MAQLETWEMMERNTACSSVYLSVNWVQGNEMFWLLNLAEVVVGVREQKATQPLSNSNRNASCSPWPYRQELSLTSMLQRNRWKTSNLLKGSGRAIFHSEEFGIRTHAS